MPYTNVPEDKWDAMDRCVKDVMAKEGYAKERAIAICHASIVEGKAAVAGDLRKSLWFPLSKVTDAEQHIIEGYASSEDPDNENDLITAEAIRKALPEFMKWAAVREMHEPSAVGTVLKAEVIDGDVEIDGQTYHNPLHIVAKIVDAAAWEKVKKGVYKGFSFGGQALKATMVNIAGRLVRKITEVNWVELSLADRPVHPGARILLWKAERKGVNMRKSTRALKKQEEGEELSQAKSPGQVIDLLQELRNEVEMSGDLERAAMYTNAIALVLQAEGAEEAVVAESAEEAEEEHEALGEEPPIDIEDAEGVETPEEDEEDKKLNMAARAKNLRKTMWATPDDLRKAMGGQAQELAKLNKTLTGIDARLQKIETQPRDGGPVLRSVSKTIAGQSALTDKEREEKQARLSEIRKAEAVESNPMIRAQYTRDKMRLESELSRK